MNLKRNVLIYGISFDMEKPLKNERMVFYLSEKLKKRMLEAETVTGVLAVNMLVKASESICEYIEKVGAITMPFSLLPKPELDAMRARLAELEAESARLKPKKRRSKIENPSQ